MTLTTVVMSDPNKPFEMTEWLEAHPELEVEHILLNKNVFYIFCR